MYGIIPHPLSQFHPNRRPSPTGSRPTLSNLSVYRLLFFTLQLFFRKYKNNRITFQKSTSRAWLERPLRRAPSAAPPSRPTGGGGVQQGPPADLHGRLHAPDAGRVQGDREVCDARGVQESVRGRHRRRGRRRDQVLGDRPRHREDRRDAQQEDLLRSHHRRSVGSPGGQRGGVVYSKRWWV